MTEISDAVCPAWESGILSLVEDAYHDDSYDIWNAYYSWCTMLGHSPRPLSDVKKELDTEPENTFKSMFNDTPENTPESPFGNWGDVFLKWDTDDRTIKGLGPRTKGEIEKDLNERLREMLCNVDAKDREAEGLGPRPVEQFEKLYRELKLMAFKC